MVWCYVLNPIITAHLLLFWVSRIPLDRAQELSHKHGLDRDMWPLLEPDVNAYTFSGSSLDDFPSEEGPSESSSTGSDFGYNQPASAGVQSESAMATPSARPSSGPALHGIHAYSLAPLHSPLYPTSGPPLMPSSYPLQGQQTQLTNELGLTIPPATFAMQPQNTAARYSSTPSMLPSFQQFDHFSQPHDLYSHTQAEHDGAWYQQSATAPAPSTSSSSSHSYAHDASNWKVSGVDFDQFINEPWRPEFPNS